MVFCHFASEVKGRFGDDQACFGLQSTQIFNGVLCMRDSLDDDGNDNRELCVPKMLPKNPLKANRSS